MEAGSAAKLPQGPEWLYEPKWDGFRCLAFRDGETIRLQSKAAKPLERYFPDVVASMRIGPWLMSRQRRLPRRVFRALRPSQAWRPWLHP